MECSITIKFFTQLIFLLAFTACVGGGGETTPKSTQGQSSVQYSIVTSASSLFEGETLDITIKSSNSSSPRSIYWEVIDDRGEIATEYFFSDSGSESLLIGESEKTFSIFPKKNTIPLGGKLFIIKIYIDQQTYTKNVLVRNLFDSNGDQTAHSVTISSLTNNGVVNLKNHGFYTVGGYCSTVGGAVVVTASNGGLTVTKQGVCPKGNEWFVGLNLSSLGDGVVNIKAQHSLGGLAGEATALVSKDTIAPTVTIETPAANSGIRIVNRSSFSINGTCSENNQNVSIQVHSASGGIVSTTTICFENSWSTALDVTSINDGNITASVKHFDSVGNELTVARSFIKDTVLPVVSISTPEEGFTVNSLSMNNLNLSGYCSENRARIMLTGDIESVPYIFCQNQSWAFSKLKVTGNDGPKFITVIITDAVGNVSFDIINFYKFSNTPVAVIANPPEKRDQRLNIKVESGEEGSKVDKYKYKFGSIELNCTTSSDYSAYRSSSVLITDDLGLNGDKKICIVGTDANGNSQSYQVATAMTWTKDTTAPVVVSFSSPAANSIISTGNVSSFTVTGTCQDNDGDVSVKVNTQEEPTIAVCADKAWSLTFDLTSFNNGAIKIEAEHSGETANRTFQKYMLPAPSIAYSSPAADTFISKIARNAFEITGTCNAYSETPNITITGGTSPVTATCNGTNWNAVVSFLDNQSAAVNLVASITDRNGVQSSVSRSFNLDTLAPMVEITHPDIGSFITSTNIINFTMSGTCSDKSGLVEVLYSSSILASSSCTGPAWSTAVNLADLPEGFLTLTVRHIDPAGNISITNRVFEKITDVPYVTIHNTPSAISDKQKLNIYVAGDKVTSYRFKIGDNSLDCSVSDGYTSPKLIAFPITSDLGADGHKKICVIGQDLYGNTQPYDEAAVHTWTKEVNPPHVEFLTPAANSFVLISNQGAFEVTGSCAINGTNRVTLEGSFGSRSVDCISSRWSTVFNFTALADGDVTIKASQSSYFTDALSEDTRKFIKLTVLPTIGFTTPAANTYINKLDYEALNITGTCNAASDSPNILVKGGLVDVEASCDGTSWNAVLAFSNNVEKNVEIDVKITDIAGQEGTASYTLKLDTIDPVAEITTDDDLIINSLNQNAFPLEGDCSDNGAGLVAVYVYGNILGTTSCTDKKWATTVNLQTTPDGDIPLEVIHSDLAGNNLSVVKNFLKDAAIRDATFANPPELISEATDLITDIQGYDVVSYLYKFGDETTDCTVSDDYIGPRDISEKIEIADLGADGHKKLCAVGISTNGNQQPFTLATEHAWVKETIIPYAYFTSPAANIYILSADEEAFTVTGTCVINGTENVKVEVGPIVHNVDCTSGTWSTVFNLKTVIPDGVITVKASQTSTLTARVGASTRNFNKYTAAPHISFTTPAPNSYINKDNYQNFTFTGSCNAASDLPNILVEGGVTQVEATCDGNTWSAVLAFPDGVETPVGLTATLTDVAGQSATATRSFLLDTIAPTVVFNLDNNIINVSNQYSFQLLGTCSENEEDSVTISIGDTPIKTINCVTNLVTNLWSTELDMSLRESGFILITAVHTDLAGNKHTVTESFIKDTFIPTATLSGVPDEISEDSELSIVVGGGNVDRYYYKIGDDSLNCTLDVDYTGPISISTPITDSLGVDGNKKICVLGESIYNNRQSLNDATSYSWKKESSRPFAYFSTPEENAYILISNQEEFAVTGTCVIPGTGNVKVQYLTETQDVDCIEEEGSWSAVLNLTEASEGNVLVKASQTSELTGYTGESERTFIKFTIQPEIAFTSPNVNALINLDNYESFTISGTCNANSVDPNVLVEGGAGSVEATCVAGTWTANVAFSSGEEDPSKEVKVTLTDKAGQTSFATRSFNLDTLAPNVSIDSDHLINLTNNENFPISGECSEADVDITIRINANVIKTVSCSSTWSTTVNVESYSEGNLSIHAIQTDVADNTTTTTKTFYNDTFRPTSVSLSGLPEEVSLASRLNVTVGGAKVVSYYYKFGDINAIDCFEDTFNGPFSVDSKITDLVRAEGEKMLCVRGVSVNGNVQLISTANRYTWTKIPGEDPEEPVDPEDPVDPEEPGDPGDGGEEGDSLLAWTYPFNGVCVGNANAENFYIEGQCSAVNGDVTITSTHLANSPVVMSCDGGEFGGEVDFNISSLNNGDAITLTLSQVGVAETKNLNVKVGKYDAENPPTIVFGGWKDVYATGIKTYTNSEEEEPGQVWIRWNEWPETNTCRPQGINVLRSTNQASAGTPLKVGDDLLDHDTDEFEDDSLGDLDFDKAYYYRLRVRISGVDFDVPASVHNPQLRVIAPPQNMTLVHRWVANQSQCSAFGQTPDPANNYRCSYDLDKYFDLKHDLLVDRQEMGCNISWTCSTDDGACVGDATDLLTTGHAAPEGAVWFDNTSEELAGTCWYKTGAAPTDWTYAPSLTAPSDLQAVSSNTAHLPPFVSIEKAKASNVCSAHDVSISGVTEYTDNTANVFPVAKRLLTQTEWRSAAEWDDLGEGREDTVRVLELGNSDGACNTRYSARNTDGELLYDQLLITGSNATENCVSRYGIQDMVGNAWEWVSDQITCAGGACTGLTGYTFSAPFNSTSGPIEIINIHQIDILYGLPRVTPAAGSVGAYDLPFMEHATFNINNVNGVRPIRLGGAWNGSAGLGSRWTTDLSLGITTGEGHYEEEWDTSFRCMIPVK